MVLGHEEKSFVAWMRNTNQIYTGDEYQLRFGIFLANSRLVREHNSQSSFTLELNKFAAYTPAEYKALLGYRPIYRNIKSTRSSIKAPAAIDWREKGAVTDVQDQGLCGSCWAFSAIGAAEGGWAVAGNTLTKFSEQNLVDCVTDCFGCDGGSMTLALDYVMNSQAGKFMLDADYPYERTQKTCRFDQTKVVGNIKEYIKITVGDEDDLEAKVAEHGPASIGIDASSYAFQLYHGGIFMASCSSTSLNHGVTCVGYGTEGEKNFWIVKNSWGSLTWGEKGYIRMIKNRDNHCGVATDALVAIA